MAAASQIGENDRLGAVGQRAGRASPEFPNSKRSWLHRLYYEYIRFRSLSAALRPQLWLSLHDMTPNVHAERQAVYCHNAAPFYRLRFQDAVLEPRFALFVLLYGMLYSINLGKNRFVIVQQQWMRREFESRFGARGVSWRIPSLALFRRLLPGT